MAETVLVEKEPSGLAWLRLNRPERRNAFDDEAIAALDAALRDLSEDEAVRAVVLTGNGAAFSAGADLAWMRRMADYSHEENLADARALADMLARLNELNKPVIAAVNGPAIAGGLGLVCAADIAVGVPEAVFAVSEVRIGLAPATISPYVLAAIGARAARRYFLTAERFDAGTALGLGLLHEIVPSAELLARVRALAQDLLSASPAALAATKALIRSVAGRPVDGPLKDETAHLIAELRASPEGREGVRAFLEKRAPAWMPGKAP
ncbi:MAG: enoyl-CoA hydratase/isomerase family protein [Alphaproteobacteria bacterium]|nr:enoyl-CoA hydratase/isomerase family protein [Alphaproteobacteria bacterium]